MADDEIPDGTFFDMIEGFSLDMIAVFKILEDEHMAVLNQATKEGWTPERTVFKLEKII